MRIGYIGLGAMGRPMAINLLEAGHDLVVCDTDESRTAILAQPGAEVYETPKDTAEKSDYGLACNPRVPIKGTGPKRS